MVDSQGQAEDALGKPMPLQSYLSLPNDQKFANTFGRHFFNVIEETGSVRALNLPSEDLVSSGNHERGGNLNKYSSERGRCILTMFVSVSMTLCILITLSLLLQPGEESEEATYHAQ